MEQKYLGYPWRTPIQIAVVCNGSSLIEKGHSFGLMARDIAGGRKVAHYYFAVTGKISLTIIVQPELFKEAFPRFGKSYCVHSPSEVKTYEGNYNLYYYIFRALKSPEIGFIIKNSGGTHLN